MLSLKVRDDGISDPPACELVLFHEEAVVDLVHQLPDDPYGEDLLVVRESSGRGRRGGASKESAAPSDPSPVEPQPSTSRAAEQPDDPPAFLVGKEVEASMYGGLDQAQVYRTRAYLHLNGGYDLRPVSVRDLPHIFTRCMFAARDTACHCTRVMFSDTLYFPGAGTRFVSVRGDPAWYEGAS